MAASVLLNFANGINFTIVDPYMGLVGTGDQLLSYTTLSTGKFEEEDSMRVKFIDLRISILRQMLENRKLSENDQTERIRLFTILDFKEWGFLKQDKDPDDFDSSFPSLKVDYVKAVIAKAFGADSPFLNRFDYNFIFIDSCDNDEKSKRYRLTAFNGYCSQGSHPDWISKVNHRVLNQLRDDTLDKMGSPDDSLLLTDAKVAPVYRSFQIKLNEMVDLFAKTMSRLGVGEQFRKEVEAAIALQTISEFVEFDFDNVLFGTVRRLVGLADERFRDCAFVFMNLPIGINTAAQCKGEIVLKSLIQLMITMKDDDYKSQFRPRSIEVQKMLNLEDVDADSINSDVLWKLYHDNEATIKKLRAMSWDDSKMVDYTIYKPQKSNPKNSHEEMNDALSAESAKKRHAFIEASSIPFFFGKHIGDWSWYNKVMEVYNDLLDFESGNDRPYYDNLTKPQQKKFDTDYGKCTYGELKTLRDEKANSIKSINSSVDYDSYIAKRKEKLNDLAGRRDDLKHALTKLGFRSRLLWITTIASLAFTLCYAYHFMFGNNFNSPVWIAACFLAMGVICVLSSLIAQLIVRGKIKKVIIEIISTLEEMRVLKDDYNKKVVQLAHDIDEADANRKTLAEMDSLLDEFESRSKRVELWMKFFDEQHGMNRIIKDNAKYLQARETQEPYDDNWNLFDEVLLGVPSIPAAIRMRNYYQNMKHKMRIINLQREIKFEGVTCFVSVFNFTCVQNDNNR